jgi:hypothetical protein
LLPLLHSLLAAKKKKLQHLRQPSLLQHLPPKPPHQLHLPLTHPHQLPLLHLLTQLPPPLPLLPPAPRSNSSASRRKPPQGGFFYG